MRRTAILALARVAAAIAGPALAASGAAAEATDSCPGGLGVARIVEIDPSSGPLYGDITRYAKEERFLAPREVVLTFDDGPMPWITRSILDTLDRFCTKATFFSVGRMALAYPASVKDVLARGHTLGGHTHTHPLNIARLRSDRSVDEIERGFAAIALAAGQPIAPFFRFPGLSDSPGLLAHLQSRGIATFTVDVVSNDSFIGDAGRLTRLTLERIEAQQGGIVLFHDIKAATAKALPAILTELRSRGYKVVHMRSKAPLVPVASYEAELLPRLAKSPPRADGRPPLLPFYGSTGPQRASAEGETATAAAPTAAGRPSPIDETGGPAVTTLAPAPRQRLAAAAATPPATTRSASDRRPRERTTRRGPAGTPRLDDASGTAVGGWSTLVKPSPARPARASTSPTF